MGATTPPLSDPASQTPSLPGRPSKVALVLNDDFSMWHFHRGLIRALKARGAEVFVLTPAGPYVEKLERIGAVHLPISVYRFLSPLRDVKLFIDLYRLFRRRRFDIVHTITIKPNVYGTVAARLAGRRFVVGLICGLGYTFGRSDGLRQRIVHWTASLMYRCANLLVRKVWFENPDDRDLFVSRRLIRPDKAVVIRGGGVDVDEYRPGSVDPERLAAIRKELGCPGEERIVLMVVARTIWSKGVREFVEASRGFLPEAGRVRFILAGATDPESPDAVPETYLKENRSASFEWIGFRRNIKEILAAADVVVLPSFYREGVPTSLLEAMAMGKPIVTCNSVGCREVVDPGKNGYLVPPRDADAFATAVAKIALDDARRATFGRHSREKAVREFSDSVVVGRVCRELYGWEPTQQRAPAPAVADVCPR